eukprot:scaffold68_cov340-Pavlova_lutheri.AAC.6
MVSIVESPDNKAARRGLADNPGKLGVCPLDLNGGVALVGCQVWRPQSHQTTPETCTSWKCLLADFAAFPMLFTLEQ